MDNGQFKQIDFETIFNKSFQFALILDPDGTIIRMNDLCYEICGELASRSEKKPFWQAYWWDGSGTIEPKSHSAILQLISDPTLKSLHDEVTFIDRNHRLHHGTRIFSPVIDDSGALSYIYVVGLDITEQKMALQSLKESEERFALAMDASKDGLYDWDLRTNRIYYSPVWKEILGYSADELPNEFSVWETLTHPDDVKAAWQMQQELISRQRDRFEMEFRMKHKKGHWVDILSRATAKFDRSGKAYRIVGTHVDISERKQAEIILIENQVKLHTIFENSRDAFGVSKRGIHTMCNPAYVRMFGYESEAELLGKPILDCIAPSEHSQIRKKVEKRARGEAVSSNYTTIGRRKDGSEFHMDVKVSTYRLKEEEYTFVILRDIMDRIHQEEEKRRLQDQLAQAQKMEAIGTLAGGIAHDFNNILGVIIGYSELSLDETDQPDLIEKNLYQILNASERAKEMVQQILDFSRKSDHTMRSIRISKVVRDAIGLLRSTIPTTILIQSEIEEETDFVFGNSTQIHQILINLCTNAAYAIRDASGRIDIRLKKHQMTETEANDLNLEPGFYFRLSVADNGKGMEPELQKRIFEPYFTTKANGEGTGMGLSVVYGIVKSHGGEIDVQSAPGKGTEIHIFFPIISQNMPEQPVIEPVHEFIGNGEQILLVDDEVHLMELLSQMLEGMGFSVHSYSDSNQALSQFKQEPDKYDLIISDMTMPGMTGTQLAAEIRTLRKTIPIILCTGFSKSIDKDSYRQKGIDALLMKPVVRKELAATIKKLLPNA